MDDFFTIASFATLTGSVVVVVVIVNTFRHAFNWGPRWFGLLLSLAIAFVAFLITSQGGDHSKTEALGWIKYITVFINGCLIYTSAFGIQNTVIAGPPPGSGLQFQSYEAAPGERKPEQLTARSPW